MSNTTISDKPIRVSKGNWLRRNYLYLLTLIFVVAIVAGIYIFYHRYPDRIQEFGKWGYLGAFVIMATSNATVILPFPGFLIIFALGAAFNPIFVGLAGGVGAALGELTSYMLGFSGRGIIENQKFYNRAAQWLERWGSLTVFVFALTPLPFDVVGIAAGILRFRLWKFLVICWCGKTLQCLFLAWMGALGREAILRYFG